MNESNILDRFKEYINLVQFDAVRIGIASPKKMMSLSYGEVKKIETINYRTLKPEKDGLFCAKIFGPQKDWECNCGKYKRMKHRGITCEKCGVEVIQSRVRRERMGHINLAAPICHIWFLKGTPSYLSIILDVMVKDLERVTYFDGHLVLNQGASPYPARTVLPIPDYEEYIANNPEDIDFLAETGAEAIGKLLETIDLSFESRKLAEDIKGTTTVSLKHKLSRKYKIIKGMLDAGIRPEWMVISTMPVIPPDLRPLVSLPGGRFASSDLNDLYRRVLNRNIRLKRLVILCAPGVIVKNEKRMLQESVDALIDNGRRGQFVRGSNKRPLKSLSEMLRGKQGRFRQNLLGKRVDYSARSVIVVEPKLKLHQCGLPKIMALELFKPYVYAELQRREMAPNLRVAKKMVNQMLPETWAALEEVVANRPVLLNRAPTLHRLGFQAFFPVLVEGKSIKLHPLVCGAYNADFDGDMMAVHVPLSKRARKEAIGLMFAGKNLISPSHGRPLMGPSQDMVLGLYFLTKQKKNVPGEGTLFSSVEEVIYANDYGQAHIQAGIRLSLNNEIINTTVGRVILYNTLPAGANIAWINQAMRHKNLEKMVYETWKAFGNEATAEALDKIKDLGFEQATINGISLGIDDVLIPSMKKATIAESHKNVTKIESLYRSGAITNGERYNKVIQVWAKATEKVTAAMLSELEQQDTIACENTLFEDGLQRDFNPIYMMLDSGARSSKQQIRQLGGMRGLMSNPSEEIIEKPVISNLKEGLDSFEYFISTHGTRKGLADTALKTADAGYLTRRLVDVSQDVVVTKEDCGGIGFISIKDLEVAGEILVPSERRAFGRIMAEDLYDPITGKLLIKEGTMVKDEILPILKDSAVTEYKVRSPLSCSSKRGICAKCYGMDLSKNELVDIGLAVGIIAAQSIGEPGTQLTLRTFHIGGTASGLVEENFVSAKHAGVVSFQDIKIVFNEEKKQNFIVNRRGKILVTRNDGREVEQIDAEYGSAILISSGDKVKAGDKLLETSPYKVILSDAGGHIEFSDIVRGVSLIEHFDEDTKTSNFIISDDKNSKLQPCIMIKDSFEHEIAKYYIPSGAHILIKNGDIITPGQVLATIPREKQRAKDITGGLPRVVELFEARNPKDPAILSEIHGTVEFNGLYKGNRRINVISDTGEISEYIVPKNKHLNVVDGDKITAGCMLADGIPNAHDILKIMGPRALQEHLVRGVQEVYGTQGVRIHDKHVEIIIRQMLRKVKITEPGDTSFVVGEAVDSITLKSINDAVAEAGKRVAIGNPILMGITKASLETDSFIAAASFQETTRVLAESAVTGQVDYLKCLKSNVALGRLISAGTGFESFREKYIGKDISELEEQANKEEELEAGLDNISLL